MSPVPTYADAMVKLPPPPPFPSFQSPIVAAGSLKLPAPFALPGIAAVSDSTIKQAALDWVNAVNVRLGSRTLPRLVPGLSAAACQCPVANSIPSATAARTTSIDVRVGGITQSLPLPAIVAEFIARFDSGKYPELDLNTEEV